MSEEVGVQPRAHRPRDEESTLLLAAVAVARVRRAAIDALAGAYEGGERAALQEIVREADRALRLTIQK